MFYPLHRLEGASIFLNLNVNTYLQKRACLQTEVLTGKHVGLFLTTRENTQNKQNADSANSCDRFIHFT